MLVIRVGIGYDVHQLIKGRPLILGGVHIPYEMGLLGHSDADVLAHAMADALLGAVALGDIGRHFPDHDPAFQNADSLMLLARVGDMLRARRYAVMNIDAVIIAQKPRLAPYIADMESNLHRCLGLAPERRFINIKATTEEGLGFTGRGEGIAAKAICLIEETGQAVAL